MGEPKTTTDEQDPWQRIRHFTIDQLITWTKLRGSAFGMVGHTTPEHWRFAFYTAIGSTPANEAAVDLVVRLDTELRLYGAKSRKTHNPSSLAAEIRWAQQTTHHAHHEGAIDDCQRPVCVQLRALVLRAGGMP